MTSSQPPVAPTFVTAALRVFDVSLGEMLWSRRTIFMAPVAAGPVVLALLLRVMTDFGAFDGASGTIDGRAISLNGPAIFGLMVWTFYLRFTVPVLGVFYGTALIADEVEDRTLTYFFTRPIPRGAVPTGKYLAYVVSAAVIVPPSVMLVYFLVAPILCGARRGPRPIAGSIFGRPPSRRDCSGAPPNRSDVVPRPGADSRSRNGRQGAS